MFAFMPEISISFKPLLHLSMEFSDSGSLCLLKCYHILTRLLDKILSSLSNKVSTKYDFKTKDLYYLTYQEVWEKRKSRVASFSISRWQNDTLISLNPSSFSLMVAKSLQL